MVSRANVFTHEQRNDIISMYTAGFTPKHCAIKLGLDYEEVRYVVQKYRKRINDKMYAVPAKGRHVTCRVPLLTAHSVKRQRVFGASMVDILRRHPALSADDVHEILATSLDRFYETRDNKGVTTYAYTHRTA